MCASCRAEACWPSHRVRGPTRRVPYPRAVTAFMPAGGTDVVVAWLLGLGGDDAQRRWSPLDDRLRLCLAQGWLMGTGRADACLRDRRAAALSLTDGTDTDFPAMMSDLTDHWREVYRDLGDRPCLVDVTDVVDLDMELVIMASESFAGEYSAGDQIPVHCFITRLVDGKWRIAATARRLPVPGWPPTEQPVPGLRV